MSDLRKQYAETRENAKDKLPSDSECNSSQHVQQDRKLLRKLDLHLMPWLCLLYLVCYLDRTNIGNAQVAGLGHSLNLSTAAYNATLTIFFVSYAIFEPLCNILLKKLRPSIFIPIIMISWGACMLGMGFVKNWSGLMASRWFLGVTEAGLFPGINYYLSCWYKRNELGTRAAVFFSSAALAGSFGGLLAAAIGKLDGVRGIDGWAWIFIVEGAGTILIGFASFLMVHDFPNQASFLTEDERAQVFLRLDQDGQNETQNEDFKIEYFWSAVKDWKTYFGMLIYMGSIMPLYAFSLFLPTIVKELKLVPTDAVIKNQLLSVPPYATAAILTVVVGVWSDRIQKRAVFNICFSIVGIIGFIMLIASTNPVVGYLGTFLGAIGIYPTISLTITWVANNIVGVYKRGIILGLMIGWGNLNGVVSSNIYFGSPRFYAGHGTVIAYMTFCLLGGSILFAFLLNRENKSKAKGGRSVDGAAESPDDFMYTI